MFKFIALLLLLFHFNGLSHVFNESMIENTWDPKTIGEGAFGRAFLNVYNFPISVISQLLVVKELKYNFSEILTKAKNSPNVLNYLKISFQRISPDICLNHELFGSSLITNTLGVFVSDKNKLSYAIEPMLGGNLEEYLAYVDKNPSALDLNWLKQNLARVAFAINFLHQKGWVWRDGSNKNIFIDFNNGLAKVSDFDISQRTTDTRNKNIPELDWNDFGKRILAEMNTVLMDNQNISDKDKIELKEAEKLLSGRDYNTPGKITSFEDFKKIAWFHDVNWQDIENNKPSSFIPKNNKEYLGFIYKDNPEILALLLKQDTDLIEVLKIKNFTLSKSFLKPINDILPAHSKAIDSAQSFCDLFYPQQQ